MKETKLGTQVVKIVNLQCSAYPECKCGFETGDLTFVCDKELKATTIPKTNNAESVAAPNAGTKDDRVGKQGFKAGDIVSHGQGSSAYAKLLSPHSCGWHAQHCLGGTVFITRMRLATDMEIRYAHSIKNCVWKTDISEYRIVSRNIT